MFCAGLQSSSTSIGILLFLGPTGSGKMRLVEAAAEILIGDSRAVIKVDCAEFQPSHEISKLIGSFSPSIEQVNAKGRPYRQILGMT
jgi:ATP-dependent Clp protease ATP-binding subunit ClpB